MRFAHARGKSTQLAERLGETMQQVGVSAHSSLIPAQKVAMNPIDTSSNQPMRIVTTSWDDGVVHDLKLAELLEARHMTGTFYVPIAGRFSSPAMCAGDLRSLAARGFEIGAHGFFHRVLSDCGPGDLHMEIVDCKRGLQELLGKKVRMFAYPRGRYSCDAVDRIKKAGYTGARTTRMLSRGITFDDFLMPTTLQVYPHAAAAYLRNVIRGSSLGRTRVFMTHLTHLHHWTELGRALFDEVLERGGIWHLYGHSWEIQENNLWDDLRQLLDYVAGRDGVHYLSNSEVIDSMRSPIHSLPIRLHRQVS